VDGESSSFFGFGGLIADLQWQITNRGSRRLGSRSTSLRRVETRISCPPRTAALLGQNSSDAENLRAAERELGVVPALGSLKTEEKPQVLRDAEEYSAIDLLVELFLTKPPGENTLLPQELQLLQSQKLQIQVSDRYEFKPNSMFLLVTNRGTERPSVNAWKKFIEDELRSTADIWNVSLYGGLCKSTGDQVQSILSDYSGKSVVAFRNPFTFFDQGQRDVLDFCDSYDVARQSLYEATFTFTVDIPRLKSPKIQVWLQQVVCSPHLSYDKFSHAPTANTKESSKELLECLKMKVARGNSQAVNSIPEWYSVRVDEPTLVSEKPPEGCSEGRSTVRQAALHGNAS
jgi:hypothetical protein